MAKRFPPTMYVKRIKDGNLEFFNASDDPSILIDMNETATLGTYKLVGTTEAKAVVQTRKPKPAK